MASPRVECCKTLMCCGHPISGSLLDPSLFSHVQAGGKKVAATEIMDLKYTHSSFQKKREVFLSNAFLSLRLSQKLTFSTSTAI